MITLYSIEITKICFLILFAIFLSFVIIFLSYSLTVSAPDSEKVSAYECGFDPYEDARNAFDVRFYVIAILFLLFDLEAVYFFPWCSSFSFLTTDAIWCLIDFAFELILGYVFAWEFGALDWA